MCENGFHVSGKDCDEKWRRLKTQHRKYHDKALQSGRGAIKWQFYDMMDEFLGKEQALSPPKGILL